MMRRGIGIAGVLWRAAICVSMACSAGNRGAEVVEGAATANPPGGEEGALIELALEFLKSSDRDTRGLALQLVREGIPGSAATLRFAELLPELPPAGQEALMDALKDRGDPAARPVIEQAMAHPLPAVRSAAIRALAGFGQAVDVPRIAAKLSNGTDQEKEVVRNALQRMRGGGIDEALVKELSRAPIDRQPDLLRVLAARKAGEAVPAALALLESGAVEVRSGAMEVLHTLGHAGELEPLSMFIDSGGGSEALLAAEAFLAICRREGEGALPVVLRKVRTAARPVYVRALGIIEGPRALGAIQEQIRNGNAAARDEAIRVLSSWREPAALPFLFEIARQPEKPVHRVLALRGVIRLAAGAGDQPPNEAALDAAWELGRMEERRLILSAVADAGSIGALRIALRGLGIPELKEEAIAGFTAIAARLEEAERGEARSMIQESLDLPDDLREQMLKMTVMQP